MTVASDPRTIPRALGLPLLTMSALGFPLSQLAIGRGGQRGALLVEGVTSSLFARDMYLVASGTPVRLGPGPRAMLYAELALAACGAVLGLRALTDHGSSEATSRTPGTAEILRRAVLGTLFGVHTWRFAIYLNLARDRTSR